MKKILIRFMLVVLITVFMASAAHSELLIYEPFDYTVGFLVGNAPAGPGLGLGEWVDWGGGDPMVEGGSLVHPTYGDIGAVGNHAVSYGGIAGNLFSEYINPDGTTYWYSFLYQGVNITELNENEVENKTWWETGGDVMGLELYIGEDYIMATSPYNSNEEIAYFTDPTAVKWMLLKVETSGDTPHTAYWWVDPVIGLSEPDPCDADLAIQYDDEGYPSYHMWWAAGGDGSIPLFRWDEIRYATDYSEVSAGILPCDYASNPFPDDTETDIDSTGLTLTWDPGCLAGVITYDVYIDPNELALDQGQVVTGGSATSYVATGDVTFDTTYYWRVDVIEDGGTPLEGIPWSFTTAPETPVFYVEPQDVTVPAGDSAQFTVLVRNMGGDPNTYEWFKSATPDGSGTPIPDSDSAVLDLTNVQLADEGYYYCVATNYLGSTESFHARLLTERLMAHWKFEGNLNDEIDPCNIGTSILPVSYDPCGIDNQAVIIDPNEFVMIENEIGRLTSITVSAWVKPATLDGDQDILTATEGTDSGVVHLHAHSEELWGQVFGPGNPDLGSASLTLGQWDHCVLKYDTEAEQTGLYLNGELVDSGGIGTNPETFPILPSLSIGAKNQAEENYFDGMIDDVRIYNYPVSDLDIALLYTNFVSGGEACIGNPEFDFNEDCLVDLSDFVIFAADWINCNLVPDCQFSLP